MLRQQPILEQLIAATMSGVLLVDAHGIVVATNPAASTMLERPEAMLVGQPLLDAMRDADQPALDFSAFLERTLDTKRELDLLLGDGRRLPVEKHVRRIAGAGSEGADLYVCWLDDLSRWRQHEQVELLSAKQLKRLTTDIPAVVFRCEYHRARRFSFLSSVVSALTGWEPDDFMEGRVGYTDLMAPADERRIWRAIGDALLSGQPYMVEYRLLHRDGSTVWVAESGRVALDEDGVPAYIVGSIADNTAIKAANAEFEGTVHALDRATAVVEFDLRGHVTRANPNFLALMGYEHDEVIGHHHSTFCTREQVASPDYRRFWERLRRGEVDNGEYLRIGKGGREVWIQATYNPIFDADGRPYKVMKFATDLSERRRMEQELRVAIDRAEDAVEARGNFLANMSHEIRTPMNAIIGFSEAVMRSELQPEQQRQLKIVVDASRSLLRLLNEILDMAKLERGAVDLELRGFDLRDLCEQMIASVRIAAQDKGLAVRLEAAAGVPAFVHGDSLRIQQVLLNLLTNAVKFTERGEVVLRVDWHAGRLKAQVQDTGIGMPADYLERIFDPFTQSDASTTRRFGGTGLGTTIAQQLVHLMEGTITVASEVGVGTVFTVELPLPEGWPEQAPTDADLPVLESLRVLAVDDTAPSLELLRITMERHRHQVTAVSGGKQAVDACRAGTFDVVLMDLQMPGVDGFEATRQIRLQESERGEWPVPIIALSAHVMEEHRRKALAAGMNGFAHKPLDPPALFAEIARVIRPGRPEPGPATASAGGGEATAAGEARAAAASAAPPAPPPLPSPLHGLTVNWKRGIALWGERALLAEHIARFLQGDFTAELQQARAAGGPAAVAPVAHRLRGGSGNLSLDALHHVAEQLELAAHAGDSARMDALLADVPRAVAAIEGELEATRPAVTAAASAPTPAPRLGDPAAVAAALVELQQGLQRNQLAPQALDVLADQLDPAALAPLRKAIDTFDFEAALAELRSLLDAADLGAQAGSSAGAGDRP